MSDYVTAKEAAALLGVTIDTLYVYVSRRGLRSVPIANSRERRYWRADVEQLRRRPGRAAAIKGDVRQDTELTLITETGLFYRGIDIDDLVDTASFEQVAALLWNVDDAAAFSAPLPARSACFDRVREVMRGESVSNQALALFPLLEEANPSALDLSALGSARTGASLLRWFAALFLGTDPDADTPIHEQFGRALGLDDDQIDLIRRLLILSADHGMEPGTYAVCAVASTGVSPWRLVATGLAVARSRRSRLGKFAALGRFIGEITETDRPVDAITRRVLEGEPLPGFVAEGGRSDARSVLLMRILAERMASDVAFERLCQAIEAAQATGGLKPNYALLSSFALKRTAGTYSGAPFLLSRSAGWIGHGIEQYAAGERERREAHYRGPLPHRSDASA